MIGILDYGLGNIKAFQNIYREHGIELKIISNYKDISKNLNKLILPGVGSFDKAIDLLKKNNFFYEILNFASNDNNKILGICVGMQILSKGSDEGDSDGLNFIDGKFIKFENSICPHVGWNNIELVNNIDLFKGLSDSSYFYFLHSYHLKNIDQKNIITKTKYNENFISAFQKKNIYGIQFHPEKSHLNGKKILLNFFNL